MLTLSVWLPPDMQWLRVGHEVSRANVLEGGQQRRRHEAG
jgi:hypothetical protein